jgi:hypothetical protein
MNTIPIPKFRPSALGELFMRRSVLAVVCMTKLFTVAVCQTLAKARNQAPGSACRFGLEHMNRAQTPYTFKVVDGLYTHACLGSSPLMLVCRLHCPIENEFTSMGEHIGEQTLNIHGVQSQNFQSLPGTHILCVHTHKQRDSSNCGDFYACPNAWICPPLPPSTPECCCWPPRDIQVRALLVGISPDSSRVSILSLRSLPSPGRSLWPRPLRR